MTHKIVLCDANTARHCLPLSGLSVPTIIIPAGEDHKTLETVQFIWHEMNRLQMTRESVLLNLGGGVVCDMGGFAAATFKRGVHFVNMPTTLLAMVDAAQGGKTGCNFDGLKNQIGVFAQPDEVVINTAFLQTLPAEELLAGAAEMLKHGLLKGKAEWADVLNFDWQAPDFAALAPMIERSVGIKQHFVDIDPHDHGLRKALNLGHTFAHAFEELALHKGYTLRHGAAVAAGLVCALYASVVKLHFPVEQLRQTAAWVHQHFSPLNITCDDYPALLEYMQADKKNADGKICFTLLRTIGDPQVNQQLTEEDIKESLDFLRESN